MSAATKLGQGAWSPEETYTPTQLSQVVEYARARAVRVMAEVDTPGDSSFVHMWFVVWFRLPACTGTNVTASMHAGHVLSWGVAYPDIVTPCQSPTRGWNNPPLNPASNETYDIVGKLLTELNGIFPDSLFHLGGDEVSSMLYTLWHTAVCACVCACVRRCMHVSACERLCLCV